MDNWSRNKIKLTQNTSTPNKTKWTSNKTVLIWSYLSFHHGSQYLRYPIRALFDPKKLKQFDLRLDEIVHTLHNDYDRLIRKYKFETANSKYELFDRQMHLISTDIHDGKTLYAHSPNVHAMWKCSDASYSSKTVIDDIKRFIRYKLYIGQIWDMKH